MFRRFRGRFSRGRIRFRSRFRSRSRFRRRRGYRTRVYRSRVRPLRVGYRR